MSTPPRPADPKTRTFPVLYVNSRTVSVVAPIGVRMMENDIRLVSTAEAARLLGLNERTVRRLVERGELREIRLGARTWLVRSELVELVNGPSRARRVSGIAAHE